MTVFRPSPISVIPYTLDEAEPDPSITDGLRRLARRDRVVSFLDQLARTRGVRVAVRTLGGEVVLEAQPFGREPLPFASQAEVALHGSGQVVGMLEVNAPGERAADIAALVATWLEDVLLLEQEIDSLSQEVVHSYEELHLLYDLGARLSNVLNVELACKLIVERVVTQVRAAKASLTLWHNDVTLAASAVSPLAASTATADDVAHANVPLLVNGDVIGVLTVEGLPSSNEFTSGDLKLLAAVAAVSAPALRHAQLYEVARAEANTDALTKVDNHRRLQERLDEEFERAQHAAHPLALILIDLDGFKLFNDVYGHLAGDQALQTVAECLRTNIRATDYVGRYGGDEFMIILPGTDVAGAVQVAERLLADVEAQEIVIEGNHLPLRLSIGIAAYPADATTKNELIAHADTALYDSKHSGGNTVRSALAPRKEWLNLFGNTFSVLEGLVTSVDAKDHYTQQHSEVVTDAALLIAQHLNLSEETLRALRIAGLLHDVGKIGIPDHVLKKPGRLTDEEYEIMKQHVVLSEMIIKGVPHLNDVLDAVAHHHERFDGRGYPYGKQADTIPLLGRIMAVADAYSAMCMDRPYRKGLSWEQAKAELERGAGTQFDPQLVSVFLKAKEQIQRNEQRMPRSSSRAPQEY